MKKKKIIILSIAIIGLLLIATGVTYAFLNIMIPQVNVNKNSKIVKTVLLLI